MKSCPPCTGECNQGRTCPRAFDEEERRPDRDRDIAIALFLAVAPWLGIALIVWVIFQAVKK